VLELCACLVKSFVAVVLGGGGREAFYVIFARYVCSGFLFVIYEDVSKSFRTGRLERELQLVQLYRYFVSQSSVFYRHNPLCCFSTSICCSCCLFRYDSVRKLLDIPSYKLALVLIVKVMSGLWIFYQWFIYLLCRTQVCIPYTSFSLSFCRNRCVLLRGPLVFLILLSGLESPSVPFQGALFSVARRKTHNRFFVFIVCNLWNSLPGLTWSVLVTALNVMNTYERVSRSFRTGLLERELQMIQLSATSCNCIAVLWISLVSFAAVTLCVASQRVLLLLLLLLFISISTQSGNFRIHPRISL
jgi:hypothetical protein